MSLKWIGDIDIPEGETSSIRLNIKCERQLHDAERGGGGGRGDDVDELVSSFAWHDAPSGLTATRSGKELAGRRDVRRVPLTR